MSPLELPDKDDPRDPLVLYGSGHGLAFSPESEGPDSAAGSSKLEQVWGFVRRDPCPTPRLRHAVLLGPDCELRLRIDPEGPGALLSLFSG